MTPPVLTSVRIDVARTADAPAATIVIDGRSLESDATREEVLAFACPHRSRAMSQRPDLGLKTIVVMTPSDDGVVPVHFFQGTPDGKIDASVPVCVNSAAAGVTIATRLWGVDLVAPAVLMDGAVYGFEAVA